MDEVFTRGGKHLPEGENDWPMLINFTLIVMPSQERLFDSVSIVLVGKYTVLKDSYMSVIKALEHAAFRCNRKLILQVFTFLMCFQYLFNSLIHLVGGLGGFGERHAGDKSCQIS